MFFSVVLLFGKFFANLALNGSIILIKFADIFNYIKNNIIDIDNNIYYVNSCDNDIEKNNNNENVDNIENDSNKESSLEEEKVIIKILRQKILYK